MKVHGETPTKRQDEDARSKKKKNKEEREDPARKYGNFGVIIK